MTTEACRVYEHLVPPYLHSEGRWLWPDAYVPRDDSTNISDAFSFPGTTIVGMGVQIAYWNCSEPGQYVLRTVMGDVLGNGALCIAQLTAMAQMTSNPEVHSDSQRLAGDWSGS